MTKEKKSAIFYFLISVFCTYRLVWREKYPLLENVKAVYKYHYIPCIWGLFVTGFMLLLGTGENRQKVSSENRHF